MVSSGKLFGNFSCTMKTITPVFIGNGRKYFSNEFVTGKAKLKGEDINIIKRIDVIEYYKDLTDDKKDKFIENLSNQNFKLEQYDSKVKNNIEDTMPYVNSNLLIKKDIRIFQVKLQRVLKLMINFLFQVHLLKVLLEQVYYII
ncbi:hypothetical protein [uncultured Methanobrevibacter sp.]|uniref:hypothetical protein n=1 Tax=uncultured Methanobrevibacter sp. TaxID=253161 RepID=UPI0025EEBD20|nr:hypothetical protein [uncultured Methanobrevibacter sp.]